MFPVAFFFMTAAYGRTGRYSAILLCAAVAAGLKLLDLFLPFLPAIKVANPAAILLLEALTVAILLRIAAAKPFGPIRALAAGIGWRALYLALTGIELAAFGIPSGLFAAGRDAVLSFLLVEGAVNAVLVYACALFMRGKTIPLLGFSPGKTRFAPYAAVGLGIISTLGMAFIR